MLAPFRNRRRSHVPVVASAVDAGLDRRQQHARIGRRAHRILEARSRDRSLKSVLASFSAASAAPTGSLRVAPTADIDGILQQVLEGAQRIVDLVTDFRERSKGRNTEAIRRRAARRR